jgi:hypothetical protein
VAAFTFAFDWAFKLLIFVGDQFPRDIIWRSVFFATGAANTAIFIYHHASQKIVLAVVCQFDIEKYNTPKSIA